MCHAIADARTAVLNQIDTMQKGPLFRANTISVFLTIGRDQPISTWIVALRWRYFRRWLRWLRKSHGIRRHAGTTWRNARSGNSFRLLRIPGPALGTFPAWPGRHIRHREARLHRQSGGSQTRVSDAPVRTFVEYRQPPARRGRAGCGVGGRMAYCAPFPVSTTPTVSNRITMSRNKVLFLT